MTRKTVWELTLMLLVGLMVLGCWTEGPIKLAAVVPLSGIHQVYGRAVRNGVDLALDELRADPEFTEEIELVVADTHSNPVRAMEELDRVLDEGALAVIGGITTAEANAMVPVIDRYDRVLLSPTASSPELTGVSRNFYRISLSDFTAAVKMARFARDTLKISSVVVVGEMHDTKGIHEVFKELFWEYRGRVLDSIDYPPHTQDHSGTVDRIMTLQPKAVYLAGYEAGIGSLIRDLKAAGYEGKILTTSAFASAAAISRVGEDAVGVFLTQTFFELDSEFAHVRSFVLSYQEKYGEPPDINAAHGYDALRVLVTAAAGRPRLRGEVHEGLREIREYEGVTGSIQFNEKGDVQKFPRVYVIGKDLLLYDHAKRIQEEKDRIRKKLEDLRKKRGL
ncbi:MAG: amino acid ABC transporter substrate-binding protein [bacterium]|nr:amino acid ABC transporter substrate-binding protein [bacterium]